MLCIDQSELLSSTQLNRNNVNMDVTYVRWWHPFLWVIGQKELVKTAVVVENSTATAVISFLKEDIGWTKRVGKIA